MTISGVSSLYSNSADSTTSIASLLQLAQSTTSGTSSTDSISSATASAATDISGPGKMMSKLAKLQQTDPDKFKQVMSDMAANLNALAQQQSSTSSTDGSGGSGGSKSLADLANKFASAAQSGDLSAFQPASSAGGTSASHAYGPHNNVAFPVSGKHHHHHGGRTLSMSSSDGSSDSGSSTSSDSASASTDQNPLAALFSQLNQEVDSSLQTTSAAS